MAKASLYNTFGSKDELVRAYLQTRHAGVTRRITQAVERYDTPRERLLAVSEGQGELFAQPDYRGCAFARASAESHPGDLAQQAAEAYRRWVRTLLTELTGHEAATIHRLLALRPGGERSFGADTPLDADLVVDERPGQGRARRLLGEAIYAVWA